MTNPNAFIYSGWKSEKDERIEINTVICGIIKFLICGKQGFDERTVTHFR